MTAPERRDALGAVLGYRQRTTGTWWGACPVCGALRASVGLTGYGCPDCDTVLGLDDAAARWAPETVTAQEPDPAASPWWHLGYVRVPRAALARYEGDPEALGALVALLGAASWDPDAPQRRGVVEISERALGERWRWSRGRVTRFLGALEAAGIIERTAGTGRRPSTIRFVRYDPPPSEATTTLAVPRRSRDRRATTKGGVMDDREATTIQAAVGRSGYVRATTPGNGATNILAGVGGSPIREPLSLIAAIREEASVEGVGRAKQKKARAMKKAQPLRFNLASQLATATDAAVWLAEREGLCGGDDE